MSQIIDAILLEGSCSLSPALKSRIADFALSFRQQDGGYRGRAGSSDPYYTDFALRLLALTRPEIIGESVVYSLYDGPIADVPECFSRLSIAEICGQDSPRGTQDCLAKWRLDSGCFTRTVGEPSAYWTFLGALCEDISGQGHLTSEASIQGILRLQQSDGGFIDCGSQGQSQTNSTCAAVGYLYRVVLMHTNPEINWDLYDASDFLQSMEHPDGGFRAHAEAPMPDLLSTFTSMTALAMIDSLKKETLKRCVRFVGSMATPDGGFRSCSADPDADLEYTYYGLGCLCLAAARALNG